MENSIALQLFGKLRKAFEYFRINYEFENTIGIESQSASKKRKLNNEEFGTKTTTATTISIKTNNQMLADSNHVSIEFQSKISDLLNKKKSMEEEIDKLKIELEKANATQQQQSNSEENIQIISNQEKQLKRMEKEFNELKETNEKVCKQNLLYETEFSEMKIAIEKVESSKNECKSNFERFQKQHELLLNNFDSLKGQYNEISLKWKESLEKQTTRLCNVEDRNRQLQLSLESTKEELKSMQSQIQSQEQKLISIQLEKENLLEKLDAEQKLRLASNQSLIQQ